MSGPTQCGKRMFILWFTEDVRDPMFPPPKNEFCIAIRNIGSYSQSTSNSNSTKNFPNKQITMAVRGTLLIIDDIMNDSGEIREPDRLFTKEISR